MRSNTNSTKKESVFHPNPNPKYFGLTFVLHFWALFRLLARLFKKRC